VTSLKLASLVNGSHSQFAYSQS